MFFLRTCPALLLLGVLWCAVCSSLAVAQEPGPAVLPPPGAAAESALEGPSFAERPALPSAAVQEDLPAIPELLLTIPSTDLAAEAVSEKLEELASPEELLTPVPSYAWYQMAYWFGPTPWDLGVEFGLNGSEGANQTQSLQAGGHMKRQTRWWEFNSKIAYNRNSANQVETQNNALLDTRLDRRLDGSPWSLFVLNQTQYDEFQPYDLRLSLNSGVGYQWLDTERFDLEGRFGAGTSREFGGPDNRWTREALFGLETEYLISTTQRLTAKVDYFPEFEDFGQYRVVTDAGWEIDLDRPSNMSLKLAVNDRYDSTPNGVDPSLLNYSVLLIWGL